MEETTNLHERAMSISKLLKDEKIKNEEIDSILAEMKMTERELLLAVWDNIK